MNDPIELIIKNMQTQYLNHADDLYASQIVSLAIQLCPQTELKVNDITPKIDLAIQLVDNAKKIISQKKMAEKQHH